MLIGDESEDTKDWFHLLEQIRLVIHDENMLPYKPSCLLFSLDEDPKVNKTKVTQPSFWDFAHLNIGS